MYIFFFEGTIFENWPLQEDIIETLSNNTLFFRGYEFDTRSQDCGTYSKDSDFYILFCEFIFRCFHLNVFISRDQHLKASSIE